MFHDCSKLARLSIPSSFESLDDAACVGVGTETAPCRLFIPNGFAFGEEIDPTEAVFEWCGGYFTLGNEYEMGDVNIDGLVTVTDVMLTMNHALGNDPDYFYEKYADMNSDSRINVADVMLIVSKVINQ